jgi:hypothetical protein
VQAAGLVVWLAGAAAPCVVWLAAGCIHCSTVPLTWLFVEALWASKPAMASQVRHMLSSWDPAACCLLAHGWARMQASAPQPPPQPSHPHQAESPCCTQVGLNYICATAERFFAVGAVLGNMVVMLSEQPSPRLLKHIIRCYLRLSDNARAREALRQCLPDLLRNPQFTACLKNDETTRRWLAQLLINVGFPDSAQQLAHDIVQPTPLQGA